MNAWWKVSTARDILHPSWVLHDGRGSFFIVVDNVVYD